MPLMFREAHATADKKQLNGEWFVLENAGATSISTAGLQVISGVQTADPSPAAANPLQPRPSGGGAGRRSGGF